MPMTNQQGDFQTAQTLETFGFLPKLTQDEVYEQTMFGESNPARVMEELEACRRNYPDHHIRLIGYDNYTQSQGVNFVVFEGHR
jgi:ribulose-bisphosphate carboxylase small chain